MEIPTGFGLIPKSVMFNKNLSLEAKALYSYFCSQSNHGTQISMLRRTILYHLKISKDTYYRYLNELIVKELIKSIQQYTEDSSHSTNTFFLSEILDNEILKTYISTEILSKPDLTLKAKGIYSYFCCFCQDGQPASLKKDKIIEDLNISPNTYNKHVKLLVESHIVTINQRSEHGRFASSDYYINHWNQLLKKADE